MSGFYIVEDELYFTDESGNLNDIDEQDIAKAFGNSLFELRKYLKLTLVELGKKLDMPNQTLSAYENGTRIPSIIQALKITAYFHIPLETFILCGLEDTQIDIIDYYEAKR